MTALVVGIGLFRPVYGVKALLSMGIVLGIVGIAATFAWKMLHAEPIDANLLRTETLYKSMEGCEAILHLATKIPPPTRFKIAISVARERSNSTRRDTELGGCCIATGSENACLSERVFCISR